MLCGNGKKRICNAVHNSSFWSVSIAQILTLIIAVGVAFFATQYKADERKQKEHAENIVLKIQAAVSDDHFVHISCEDNPKDITINNRKINNAIDLLKQYAELLKFKENAQYIENEFRQYRSFVEEKSGIWITFQSLKAHSENMQKTSAANVILLYFNYINSPRDFFTSKIVALPDVTIS